MKNNYAIYCLAFLLIYFTKSVAQPGMTLYNMDQLSSRSSMNPALMNHGKVNINLPGVSNTFLSYSNSSFAYQDLVRHSDDDSLYIDINHLTDKLRNSNYLSIAAETDLLAFGIRIKKSYIALHATEKIQTRFSFPKSLIQFLSEGNGALLGQQVDLSFGLDVMHYREYGFTFAHNINKNMTLGANVKYLYGMENIHTSKSSLSLYTDPETFAITARSNIRINTSGIDKGSNSGNFELMDYAFNKKNHGVGIDLGFNCRIHPRFTVSGSLIDLGFINWKGETNSYSSTNPDAEFTYSGIDINQYSNDSSSYDQALHDLTDTLFTSLNIDTNHSAYTTMLPSQIYMGGNYIINDKHNLGLLVYNQFYNKKLHPAASLSFNKMFGNWLNVSVSYTVINNTYDNLGFGFALNNYDVQLFAVTDNIIGIIFPQKARNTNIRAGIALKFGNKK